MSDYSEIWNELHKDQISKENKADKCRKELAKTLNTDQMIGLMFGMFLRGLPDHEVIEIYENLFGKGEIK